MTGHDGQEPYRPRRFVKNRAQGKIFGVCAGLADYFEVDRTLVRVAFVVATLLGVGSMILVYLAIALIAD